ncbi:hypothetical protein KIS1582_4482 [Cytobacillus firmus]|uniref:Uncharacterized protein n=1 Tax=Cytobacillus firmus TaxID=1399 RepID=A0A800MSN1_CYTFI|nr:hypothetical protein KIS1582_4482 [Cytobacillus firmus]
MKKMLSLSIFIFQQVKRVLRIQEWLSGKQYVKCMEHNVQNAKNIL